MKSKTTVLHFCLLAVCSFVRAQPISTPSTRPDFAITVMTSDGKPAAGAIAVLVPPGHSLDVTDGRSFDDDPAYLRATADAAGRLHFGPGPASSLLVVLHAAGSADVRESNVEAVPQITLQRWGAIKGRRMIGNQPGAGREVIAWNDRDDLRDGQYDPHLASVTFSSTVKTDASGNYQIDRFPPGPAYVSQHEATRWGDSLERPMQVIDVQPGQTCVHDVGGQGRAVVGRVKLPPELLARQDWTYWLCMAGLKDDSASSPMPESLASQPLSRQIEWWTAFNASPAAADRKNAHDQDIRLRWAHSYPFDVLDDGTFRIDDVEPGAYRLDLTVMTRRTGSTPRIRLAEGHGVFDVNQMDGNRSDIPLEIPPIPVEMIPAVQVGDVAPDFTIAGFDDRPITLSTFRGRLVLLDFWATWCGPCIAEIDQVKAAYDRFGNDERFTMIGLSADETPDAPARFVAEHHLNWHQGYLGGTKTDSTIEQQYGVDGIPSIWLIGPDGKVLRKNLRGDEIETAVAKALAN